MRLFAVLVGIAGLAACVGGAWLAWRTLRFALGPDYALFHGWGLAEGNGLGIFIPALLLLMLGGVLVRFAGRLWSA